MDKKNPNKKINLSGVCCPINFVKTKLILETMNPGEILEVLLDNGEPMINVPRSVKNEGHKVIYAEKIENQTLIQIEKG